MFLFDKFKISGICKNLDASFEIEITAYDVSIHQMD